MLSLQSSHPDHQSMNCFACQFDRPVHATAIGSRTSLFASAEGKKGPR
jgi:hypothetical protein